MIRRWFFNLAAAISCMIFVAALPLWICSLRWEMFLEHVIMPRVGANWHWRDWQLWSQAGGAHFFCESYLLNDPHFADSIMEKPNHWYRTVQPLGTSGPQMRFPQNLRPFWDFGPMSPGWGGPTVISTYNVNVFVPYWCVLAVSAPLPALWLIWTRRRRRGKNNRMLCTHCGYNLTGNTSGVCPECGTAIGRSRS